MQAETCGSAQCGSAAMAASIGASGSPTYDSRRQSASSACSMAGVDPVETGQPRASVRAVRLLAAGAALDGVRAPDTVAAAVSGRSATAEVEVDVIRKLLRMNA